MHACVMKLVPSAHGAECARTEWWKKRSEGRAGSVGVVEGVDMENGRGGGWGRGVRGEKGNAEG